MIYIGESENVKDRIANHDKHEDWMKHVGRGNQLCFSFSPIAKSYRARVEAALIYTHKPHENIEYRYGFPFDKTHVTTKGARAFLK